MRIWIGAALLILVAFLVSGCPSSKRAEKLTSGNSCPVLVGGKDASPVPNSIEGTVVQILPAGRYLYIELNTGTGSVWVAAQDEPVVTGDRISCEPQTLMEKFESKSLKRMFDRVYFAGPLTISAEHRRGISKSAAHTFRARAPETAAMDVKNQGTDKMNVAPAEGGVTIADLAAGREKLAGSEVLLRGKVTKCSANIMDANWLHVRDDSDKRDLVVTTKAVVHAGDTVLIRGCLERDVDLGSGYFYDLLIRNAEITAEKSAQP